MQPVLYFPERPTVPCEGRSTAADPKNEAYPSLECTQQLGIPASHGSRISSPKFAEGRSDGYQKNLQGDIVPSATTSETPSSPYVERTNIPSQNTPEKTVAFNHNNPQMQRAHYPMEQDCSTNHLPKSNESTIVSLPKSSFPIPERPGVLGALYAELSERNSAPHLGRPEKPVIFKFERSGRLGATHGELCKRDSAPCLGRPEKQVDLNHETSDRLGAPHAQLCKTHSEPCLGRPEKPVVLNSDKPNSNSDPSRRKPEKSVFLNLERPDRLGVPFLGKPEKSVLNPKMPGRFNAPHAELHESRSVPYLGRSERPLVLEPPKSDGHSVSCLGRPEKPYVVNPNRPDTLGIPCQGRPEKPDILNPERAHQLGVSCMGKPDVLNNERSNRLGIPSSGRPEKSDDFNPKRPHKLSVPCLGRPEKPNVLDSERPDRLCVSGLGGPGKPDALNSKRPVRLFDACLGRSEKSDSLNLERPDRVNVTFLRRAEKPDVINPKRSGRLGALCAEFYERRNATRLGKPKKPLILKSVSLDRPLDAPHQKTSSQSSQNRLGVNFREQHRRSRVPYFKTCRQKSVHEKDRGPSTSSSHIHPETACSPLPERPCIPWMETPKQIPCQMRSNGSLCKGLRKVLILLAHPDDECMFFAPTILNLIKLQHLVFVMCFSSGNYYNQGEIRKDELVHSCGVLGIPPSRVTVVEHRDLPDSPDAHWDPQLLSIYIMQHVQAKHINLILTFDKGGVSGHINHISLFDAVRYLLSEGKLGEACPVLILETVNILRKYLSILDVPISWLQREDVTFMLTAQEYRRAKRAMMCHQSQLLWFRHVYLLFSRYMWINSLNFLSGNCASRTPDKNLKIEKKTS